ncbi:MAG: 5-(carboxyamino)imidazole ribonucleotide mutase [Streptococcaceae bacterium]|jgi:5-(carboxyamino)imidazole ribonucleotide mutase|nr:5-(carboxyamino)imidazole ribonucleotide mutase [Streptococcaceae bacterium]
MTEVAIIMGSSSDWTTMKLCAEILDEFGVNFDKQVVSAHRTPERMMEFAKSAQDQGFKLIIAGAGGAAHLPGMVAAMTTLPVIGVPIKSRALSGIDSLYSIVQMPAGVPVATMAIGEAGAKNAALYAIQMLAVSDAALREKLIKYREAAAEKALISTADLI